MVTREHEAPIEMLSKSPELMLAMLEQAGHGFGGDVKVISLSERVTQMNPAELLADKVVLVETRKGPDLVVIFEVQRRKDLDKELTWPNYVTAARLREECPVALLIWCPTKKVAAWARRPISLGPAGVITPWVITPADFPVILDPSGWVGRERLAVVAALAHENHPRFEEIADVLAELLDGIEKKQAAKYYRNLRGVVSRVAFEILEGKMATMTYGYRSEIERQFVEKGEALGEERGKRVHTAELLLRMLEVRGLEPTESVIEAINNTDDVEQLDSWLLRAGMATTLEEVFG